MVGRAWLLCLVACVPSLESLQPFPCADDGSCPNGFDCIPGIGCTTPDRLEELVPFACGEGGSCPSGFVCLEQHGCVPAETCDPDLPACSSPARPKCTIITLADLSQHTQCVPQTGAVGVGAQCVREFEATTNNGRDDCAAGAFCSQYFGEGTQLACREFCDGTADCAAGQACGSTFATALAEGLCVARCQLGDGCPAGRSCKPEAYLGANEYFATCVLDGTLDEGMTCLRGQCATGMECYGNATSGYYCRRICATTAPCPSGAGTCAVDGRFADAGAGAGTCECTPFGDCGPGKTCKWRGLVDSQIPFCEGAGTVSAGEPCSGPASCPADHSCLGRAVGGASCLPNCDAAHPCAAGFCDALDDEQNGAGVCSCDPFAGGGGCGVGKACQVRGNTTNGALRLCGTPGAGAPGAPCVDSGDCVAGTVCWGSGTDFKCRPHCDVSHPCSGGAQCQVAPGLPNGGGVCF